MVEITLEVVKYGAIALANISAVLYKLIMDKKRHTEITKNQKQRNQMAFEHNLRLMALQDSIEMMNGYKTPDRVAEIKHMAYGDQKNYWVREMIGLFQRNNISIKTRPDVIKNIKVINQKAITNTDRMLARIVPSNYLASTKEKVQLVNDSNIPETGFLIFMDAKKDCSTLFGRLCGLYDDALGLVKTNFYQDDGTIQHEQ